MFKSITYFAVLVLLFLSCQNTKTQNEVISDDFQKLDTETSISMNKYWVEDEAFKITQYCERQGWKTKVSKSGLHYMLIENGQGIVSPKVGDEVVLSYDIRLMDPDKTRCYHSDTNGLAKFKMEQSLVESGLHEVVSYLREGDSALVVLPFYLAHGIAGNSDKIPPLASVLYYIKIIDVKV